MKSEGKRPVFLFGFVVLLFSLLLISQDFSRESFAGAGGKPVADFSRFVVVGDSLSAGVQNFSLNEGSQPHSYAALIAQQAGANLPLPLIALPGFPAPLQLISVGPPPVVVPGVGFSTERVNPLEQPYNVSVPNLKIDEVLGYRPDCVPAPDIGGIRQVDINVELVLGLPGCLTGQIGSEIETVEALRPTFAILWVGNNDTLWAVVNGVTSEITNPVVFSQDYEEIVRRLVATRTKLVIANLPDVTIVPYLTSAEDVAALLGQPLSVIGPVLGISPGDYVTLFAFDAIQKILSGALPGPLPDPLVVSADEINVIKASNLLFNSIVYEVASHYNIPVVDIRGLMQEVDEKGIVVGGQRLTMDYLGGIFTLDGFHPTHTGHAIVANNFIKTINQYFNANIPPVDVEAIKEADPLVFPDTGHPPSSIK